MKIAYFPNQTALQSEPIWGAFLNGCRHIGIEPVENSRTADCAVIWSVLWNGRMRMNESVFNHYRSLNKPVFIIEVGALDRGRTWKISANHISTEGIYGNTENIDYDRARKLGIGLQDVKTSRKDSILFVGQHERSLQWQNQPTTRTWLSQKVAEIQKYTDRPIIFRPHPRHPIGTTAMPGVIFERPNRILDTYDKFDIDFDHHCVINHNSGPGIQAAIAGTPVICDKTSLAYPLSSSISKINEIFLPDRQNWFHQILHTEWTVDEIGQGIPQKRILNVLNR
jgi:hypothetical protein